MIPFALLCCDFIKNNNDNIEVRALEIAPDFFTFRCAKDERVLGEIDRAVLHFWNYKEQKYRDIVLIVDKDFEVLKESGCDADISNDDTYFINYKFISQNDRYKELSTELSNMYLHYIELKQNYDDSEVSRQLVDYQVDESRISHDFATQRKLFFKNVDFRPMITVCGDHNVDLGISLSSGELWEEYLKADSFEGFLEHYFETLTGYELKMLMGCGDNDDAPADLIKNYSLHIKYVYIGNQFCNLLFPEDKLLDEIIDKAVAFGHVPVIAFSTMSQHMTVIYKEKLIHLSKMYKSFSCFSGCISKSHDSQRIKCEIVVSDIGMLELIKELHEHGDLDMEAFSFTLGVQPLKRRKDVRLPYLGEKRQIEALGTGVSVDDDLIGHFYDIYNVSRISLEGHVLPSKRYCNTVYFPYYQMNTGTWCTMYAACHNGDRGRQEPVYECPKYCRHKAFLYPDELHMVGRFNSLFGFDDGLIRATSGESIKKLLTSGVDRFVLNLI